MKHVLTQIEKSEQKYFFSRMEALLKVFRAKVKVPRSFISNFFTPCVCVRVRVSPCSTTTQLMLKIKGHSCTLKKPP